MPSPPAAASSLLPDLNTVLPSYSGNLRHSGPESVPKRLALRKLLLRETVRVLMTGCADFIGSAVSRRLLTSGGLESSESITRTISHDPQLKLSRVGLVQEYSPNFEFIHEDLGELSPSDSRFSDVDAIVHLGAQAGVRFSIERPAQYVTSNLVGFANILELARRLQCSTSFMLRPSLGVRGEPSTTLFGGG